MSCEDCKHAYLGNTVEPCNYCIRIHSRVIGGLMQDCFERAGCTISKNTFTDITSDILNLQNRVSALEKRPEHLDRICGTCLYYKNDCPIPDSLTLRRGECFFCPPNRDTEFIRGFFTRPEQVCSQWERRD